MKPKFCPFCGHEEFLKVEAPPNKERGECSVSCVCGASMKQGNSTREEIIKRWNARAKGKRTINRNAESGKFASKKEVAENPKGTVSEKV